jgi:hypothetical protein
MLCFKTTDWLQRHLLTCPFKWLTGIDCPGCGFQRSFTALIKGNFQHSFVLYPATVPLLLLLLFSIADACFKIDTPKGIIKRTMFILCATVVVASYSLKMWRLFNHQPMSAWAVTWL